MGDILSTILDILRYTDIPTALSMITTMSGDQTTVSQLKEELETVKKLKNKLTHKLEKCKDACKALMQTNNKLKLDATNRERTLQKVIGDLKVQLDEERKHNDKWDPQVKHSCVKLDHLLTMVKAHIETSTQFAPLSKE